MFFEVIFNWNMKSKAEESSGENVTKTLRKLRKSMEKRALIAMLLTALAALRLKRLEKARSITLLAT